MITGTGGGYGDPLNRPVESVSDDVRNGYITVDQAKQDYGIELDPVSLEIVAEHPARRNRKA